MFPISQVHIVRWYCLFGRLLGADTVVKRDRLAGQHPQ